MHLSTTVGSITLDQRLDRLARTLHARANQGLRDMGIEFDHCWTPIYRILVDRGPASLSELADIMGLDHPAVLHLTRPMIEAGLLQIHRNRLEGHTRLYELSEKGEALKSDLYSFWERLDMAHQNLFRSVNCDLRDLLDRVEQSLIQEPLSERLNTVEVETVKHMSA